MSLEIANKCIEMVNVNQICVPVVAQVGTELLWQQDVPAAAVQVLPSLSLSLLMKMAMTMDMTTTSTSVLKDTMYSGVGQAAVTAATAADVVGRKGMIR